MVSRLGRKIAVVVTLSLVLGAGALSVYHLIDDRNLAYAFTLRDQNGRDFRLTQERGHAVAVFFGYTHCTDVCPTTLANLERARASIGAQGKNLSVIFVTVDPKRDRPAVIKRYLRLFDNSFVGLTGSEGQLETVYRAYHVWHQQLPSQRRSADYEVAHSSAIYFIDPRGHLRMMADWEDSLKVLAHDMRMVSS